MLIHNQIYPVLSGEELLKSITGSNQNGVLFVHNSSDKDHMDLLYKILSAINFSKEHILMMKLPERMYAKLPSLVEGKIIEKIVFLGVSPRQLCFNMNSSKYEIVRFNQQELLVADSLLNIAENKESKRNLWIALKEMFGV